ncbi:hypothetical protein [Corynebacterium amycolatum]|uniref:hypothetical protein n=1 Tax=Corynebacterium amycolatum TaxID=43765 RepID=UPI00234C2085|nr:hypothetical protein [Corynebacterium amycolatum]MDC7116144.1 hypothetical protein [Corynebacterium amycolatum]
MTISIICAALTPIAVILGVIVGAATLKRERADRKHDSQPTPEETAPTQEELAPLPDYGDTYYFEDIGVSGEGAEEYIWTEYGPRRNTPPLDPPPSIQKDLYDAKCGAIKLTNPLGETGWQPTVGRIELWYTDVQHIRAIFDGANAPHDAVRHSCGSEEVAIERAKRMKKYLIEMHESRLRRKWEPVE